MLSYELGSEEDAADFKYAVKQVMMSGMGEEKAQEFVWNNGKILFNAATCLYCNHVVRDDSIQFAKDEDTEWAELAQEHADNCRWISTRAFRLA